MNDAGWEKLVDAIDIKFGLEDHGKSERPMADRPDLTEYVDFVTFIKEGERFRLERIQRPAIIDRKSIYHRAAGSGVRFENIYDPDNYSAKTVFYREAGDDWEEVTPEDLAL